MRATLVAIVLLAALAGPTRAGEVICGKDWVSFVPYSATALNLAGVAILLRKSDIRKGSVVLRSSVDVGFLRVRKGLGWGAAENEFKVPKATFLAIRACLLK